MAEEEHKEEEVKAEEIPVTLPEDKPKAGDIEEKAPKGEVTPKEAKEIARGKFVTVKEFAGIFDYSTAWITILLQEGKIHGVRPLGGNWRIPKGEIDRLTKEGLRKPVAASEVDATEIKVTDEHIKRVITQPPEKKEESEGGVGEQRKIGWPLTFLFPEDRK